MKSDKVVISGTLEESKLRAAEKAKQPQVDNGTKNRHTTGKAAASTGRRSGTPIAETKVPGNSSSNKDGTKRDAEKKRKQPEDSNRSPPRTSRPRIEEKAACASKVAGEKKGDSQDLVVLSSRESQTREPERRGTLPPPCN